MPRPCAALLLAFLCFPAAAQTITPTATFHNVGFVVDLPAATSQTLMRLYQKPAGAPAADYREIHPLAKLTSTRFAGSAFGLQSGTSYDFKFVSAAFAADQFVTVATRVDAFPDATVTTYHVSALTGDDARNGSSFALAFKTLAKALSVANAGAKVLLYDGIYYEGDLTAPRSGTPTAPIVLENAPGMRPVLSGLDPSFTTSWVLHDAAAHVYRTPCTRTPANAYLDGVQFYHFQALADLLNPPWAQRTGYHVDGTFLYARFPGDAPPGTHVVTIPMRTTGLTISSKSYLQIRGLEFCYYGLDAFHRAIYIDGGDFNLIDRCSFHHNGVGVAFKRAADFNTVQNCSFTESPISTWSWHAVKDGGTDYESGGILVYGSNQVNRGNVIRSNTFTDMFDASHLYSDDPAGPTENLDFHHNLIQGCNDDAVETDGAGSNCRIYANRFHDFLTGVSVAPAAVGPTYIFRNVLSDWRPSEEFDGYPFKFNVSSSLPIQWVHLYHNTCTTSVPGQNGFWFKQYSNWTNVISRNNIYAGTRHALESAENVSAFVDLDYDCLYTTQASPLLRWAGVSYNTLALFASAVGEETHAVFSAPGFLNAAARDYYLAAGSALVDRGLPIPGVNDGFLGAAPDLGAFEQGGALRGITAGPGGVIVDWQVGPFVTYQLQASSDLSQPGWQNLGSPVQAGSTSLQTVDAVPGTARKFYRLVQVAPEN